MLGLGSVLGVEAEEGGKLGIGHRREDAGGPAKGGGGDSQRCEGVAEIMLAVAEGTLAVLPGLPDVDAAESHQDGVRRELGADGGPGGGGPAGSAVRRR